MPGKHPAYRMGNFMPNKDLRIFVGPAWFGKIAPTLAAAFKAKGLRATFATEGELPTIYADAEYDVLMDSEV